MLLKIIKLARSTYYYHLKQLDQNDKDYDIKAEIQAIFTEHKGNYGYRRMTLELRNRGIVINHKRVQRLMKVLGLTARIRQSTSKRISENRVANLAEKLVGLAKQSYSAVSKTSPMIEEVRYYAQELLRLSERRQVVLNDVVALAQL